MQELQALEQTLYSIHDESKLLHQNVVGLTGRPVEDKATQQLYFGLHFLQNLILRAADEDVRERIARHRQDLLTRRLQRTHRKRRNEDLDLREEIEALNARVVQFRNDIAIFAEEWVLLKLDIAANFIQELSQRLD
jgi:hypothetical protein